MAKGELQSAERRISAGRADIALHAQGVKHEALNLAKSPYVIGGALATAVAAGLIVYLRHRQQPALKAGRPRDRADKFDTALKWGRLLLPLLGMLVARKEAGKIDPRIPPLIVHPTRDKATVPPMLAPKRGFFANQWGLIKAAFSSWSDDYAPSMGAALSYYTLFSIAPLLIIVIAVAGMIFGEEAARGEILGQLRGVMGDQGALVIEGMLKSAHSAGKDTWAAIVSTAVLLLGATAVFGELQSALDRIWRTPAPKSESGLWYLVRTRLLSFGLVLGLGFLLMVSLVVSAALAALGKFWGGWFGQWEGLLQAVNFAVSFAIFTVLFAMIYKIMPRARISWHDVWMGAGVTALLFTVGKVLIGLYLGKSSIASGFGAAGSLVVLLAWVYYSAQVFLLGAEYTWVYAKQHGSHARLPAQPAAAGVPSKPD